MSLRPDTLQKYVELAKPKLVEYAKKKDSVSYKDLMKEMGGPGRGYIGEVLEKICQGEYEKGRPLLSALVVHSNDRLPGDAFWELSFVPEDVRKGPKDKKKSFWENECSKLYKHWESDTSVVLS